MSFYRLLAQCAVFALAVSAVAIPASAQNTYFTVGTSIIDAAHSVTGNANVGIDSSGKTSDSSGSAYNPVVNVVTGGSVSSQLQAYGIGQVNISGGSIGNTLVAFNTSRINISGGSIGTTLQALNSSQLRVSGGSISNALLTYNTSLITISGGTFGKTVGINFLDDTTGGFTLVGNNLKANFVGANTFWNGTDYALSGTLQDGTNLSGYILDVGIGSAFTLQAVPEPGSVALLVGLGVSGAGLLARCRRARK